MIKNNGISFNPFGLQHAQTGDQWSPLHRQSIELALIKIAGISLLQIFT